MPSNPDLLDLVASIVSAHVAHNAVTPEALPGVIRPVDTALSGLGTEPPAVEKPEPVVPIKKSVFPDYIVCLEDGKQLRTLKRHLNTSHGMTAEQYRARWSLPRDYPMVAPKYAERRSSRRQGDWAGAEARSLGGTRRTAHTASTGGCPGQARGANGDGHVGAP